MSLVEARKVIPIQNQIAFAMAVLEFPFPGKRKTEESNAIAAANAALDIKGETRQWSQAEVFRWRALNNLYRRFSATDEEQKVTNDLFRGEEPSCVDNKIDSFLSRALRKSALRFAVARVDLDYAFLVPTVRPFFR